MKPVLMIFALVVGGVVAFTNVAGAAEMGAKKGYYGGLAGGWTTRNDVDSEPVGGGNITKIKHDDGYRLAGSAGYAYGNGVRADIEISYAKYDIDAMAHPLLNGGADINGKGDVSSISTLVNAYYDFHNSSDFTPAIGLGIGPVHVSSNDGGADNANITNTDDSDWVLGIGATAGVSYALSDKVDIVGDYKFMWSTKPKLTDDAGTSSEQDGIRSHAIQIGLRYFF